MNEILELRNKPELKIILNTDEFEIVDASQPKNNGIYSFSEIKSVELNSERTDWFISTLSQITDFLMGGTGNGGNFKNKANLKLRLTDRNLKIWLNDANLRKAERVKVLINSKKPSTQHQR
ncbi:hypothetical protein [Planktosalinus lacus]|uniref:Uncharacterized protein n=1 Tax=Planktosalinus lacus TaxID=1526573 RepID=A0A8J2VC26_9FLAO|nr:hypothetical protein [Planktosalinus lacus]GGE02121.1 hypothetical protein GCM10011312_26850 [Planktosalinus lacus]